ncbi:polysaccharide deacetylase family protein [Tepidibacter formicigenes]|jgi:peptidoglycan/xylan/chitin deacetylase (PgdA/CDA1 family)|uniref:Polysaccharide deacetylase n=1 Tax=Tepidibacter formicigenes DSM 15518 TaxID=1123349 RepID=A0A1M6PN74_9FIRM|nr:polysaccharide deacetylase family protein [Tepidibacter formicigenes]SHK09404.1 Polysaccharide deacetylase [Tepidibacter formicigenes DSM 15518]
MRKKISIFLILLIFMVTGCTNKPSNESLKESEIDETKQEIVKDENKDNIENKIDYEKIKPNELGKIMVLMYHNIGEKEATWTRTPDNFKKDLNTLYEKGYRAIRLIDYTTGNINTQAGFTPVVITFDDGNENNFRVYEENGEVKIDPNCAIGILEEFKKNHPDFNTTATFFLNSNIFNQPEYVEYKLKFLIDNGYDIGNHTLNHTDLSKVDKNKIQNAIGKEIELIQKYIPNYDVNTLALPFGGKPKEENYVYSVKGIYNSINYENKAILLVGWDPYKSPYHKNFDSSKIHRVRASEVNVDGVGIYDWIKKFDEGKEVKFISDGDSNTIAIPKNYKDVINKNIVDKKIITY